jgi:hypothetical protein
MFFFYVFPKHSKEVSRLFRCICLKNEFAIINAKIKVLVYGTYCVVLYGCRTWSLTLK